MILLAGVYLLLLIMLTGVACLRVAALPDRNVPGTVAGVETGSHGSLLRVIVRVFAYAVLATVLAILLLRPDEEVESGEDAGAYFNAALSYAGSQAVRFADPAFAELLPGEHQVFRYGHAGFLQTKDAVLWSDDLQWSRVGPHFFPAYSILLSVPAALGFPYAAFWFSPVFAILIAGLLVLLTLWLTGRPLAGLLIFPLFILNPAVIWNARCLRAEWPASFLVMSGLVLWLAHNVMHRKVPPAQAFLGGLALATAGWFHVTAFFVVIPAVMVSLWMTRRTCFWTAWWCGLLLGCGGFIVQVIWITDPYGLKYLWSHAPRRNPLIGIGILSLAGIIGLRLLHDRLNVQRFTSRFMAGRWIGGLASLGCLLIMLLSMRYRNDQGIIPGLPAWSGAYVSMTDFYGVWRIFSRTGFMVALAGLVILCVRTGQAGQLGRRLFLMLAPASLTIGWVVNYMFETRRMVAFLVPLFLLATTTGLVTVSTWGGGILKRRWPHWATAARMLETGLPCLMAILLLCVAVRGRAQLYTVWNNQGTYRFYNELARDVRASGDFLFAEYTQTAVPIEHLSGLPLLPIAWGYRTDTEYRQAEQIAERLVRAHPERRHLLISPFSGAAVPGLQSEPLLSRRLESVRLGRARRSIPVRATPRQLTLHLHRLRPADHSGHAVPYIRTMDSGRLGLDGAANFIPERTISLTGVPLEAGTDTIVSVRLPEEQGAGRLFFILAFPDQASANPLLIARLASTREEAARFTPGPGWKGVEFKLQAVDEPVVALEFKTAQTSYVTDIFWVDAINGQIQRLHALTATSEFQMDRVESQWLRASSAIALPVGPAPRWLWMLATPGQETDTVNVHASIQRRGSASPPFPFTVAPGWNWQLIPLAPSTETLFDWHDLDISPAWDPALHDFPKDLGLRVHLITVLPSDT